MLIGGLGLGYALDEALASPLVGLVTVVEYEPTVVRWFQEHGGERAARVAALRAAPATRGEPAPAADGTDAPLVGARVAIVVADVADVLRDRPGAFDLVCLDTDNGPGWLVREANAGLYDEAGVSLAHDALRRGGAVVVLVDATVPRVRGAAADRVRGRDGGRRPRRRRRPPPRLRDVRGPEGRLTAP